MQGFMRISAIAVAASSLLLSAARAQVNSEFAVSTGEHMAHIMQTPARAEERRAVIAPVPGSPTPALLYNGGPVMTSVTTYAIFWTPATLQTGAATGVSPSYEGVQTAF